MLCSLIITFVFCRNLWPPSSGYPEEGSNGFPKTLVPHLSKDLVTHYGSCYHCCDNELTSHIAYTSTFLGVLE